MVARENLKLLDVSGAARRAESGCVGPSNYILLKSKAIGGVIHYRIQLWSLNNKAIIDM